MKSRIIAVAALATLFMGCTKDQLNFLPTAKIIAQISPLEFEGVVKSNGAFEYTALDQELTFRADKGSTGATITGFEVVYENQAGQPILSSGNSFSETLGQPVEAGKTCTEAPPVTCEFTVGPTTIPISRRLLSGNVALAYLDLFAQRREPTDWRARITFFGKDGNGKDFQFETKQRISCKQCSFQVVN
jgi:hypothetical protein